MIKNVNIVVVLAILIGGLCVPITPALGRSWYVDHAHGHDSAAGNEGHPFKTINAAIDKAKPGDVVNLVPTKTPYRQMIELHNVSGEAGKPITINGHGAVLSGSFPLDSSHWKEVSPGLWRCDDLYQRTTHGKSGSFRDSDISAVMARYFMIFNGKMNWMGRTSKGPKKPFKKPEDLKPGQWTFVRKGLVFYIKLTPGKSLASAHIQVPLLEDGAMIYGKCSHLVLKNLTFEHCYNDGVGIHGYTRDIKMYNIASFQCGDDGMSAHDDCHLTVDGFISIGNSTGMCHAGKSQTKFRNVYIAHNRGVAVLMVQKCHCIIENAIIKTSASKSITITTAADNSKGSTQVLRNVLIVRKGSKEKDPWVRVLNNCVLIADHCTFKDLSMNVNGGTLKISHSIITGKPKPMILSVHGAKINAKETTFNIKQWRKGHDIYNGSNLGNWVKTIGAGCAVAVPGGNTRHGVSEKVIKSVQAMVSHWNG